MTPMAFLFSKATDPDQLVHEAITQVLRHVPNIEDPQQERAVREIREAAEDRIKQMFTEAGRTPHGWSRGRMNGLTAGCSNCGLPINEHCDSHIIPCCPGKCPSED